MFYHTFSLINKDHLINLCTQKLSLSFQVTTVWTLSCSPHLFSIPFIKSALLCAAAADVSPPTSGRRAGVGWELGVLASIHTTILPPHSPPQIPLAPQSLAAPRALIPYGYLGPILRISWAYIDHVFALYIGPVIFSEHFQHTLTISSPHLHNILTTPPKQ